MKKIGIITFQETNNYGAIFQNYALQQAIRKLGAEPETLDYKSEYIGKPYRLQHLKNKGLFGYLFGILGYMIYLPRTKKCNEFRKIIKFSQPITKKELNKIEENYDHFITGSDQVWNCKLTGMDTAYMLDFVKDKRKCSSYAASIGLPKLELDIAKKYDELIKDFHCVSVRESSAAKLLEEITTKEIQVVSDPCLLLNVDEWKLVTLPKKRKNPFVLVYQLGVSGDVVKLAKKIAKEKKLKIVFVPFPVGELAKGKWAFDAGNADLLSYIRDAEYVITDSFHGTLLSIIFNKQFFTKVAGTHAGVGSRIYDLLDKYGLRERIITENIRYDNSIDYKNINMLIEKERESSINVLKLMVHTNVL